MFYVFNILSLGICKPSSVSQLHLVLGVNSAIYHVTLVKCSSLNMVYGPGTAIVYWLFKPMYGSFRTLLTDSSRSKTSAINFYLRLLLYRFLLPVFAPRFPDCISRLLTKENFTIQQQTTNDSVVSGDGL